MREKDSESFVVEYKDDNIWSGFLGNSALELIDMLIMARRKAIENLENGGKRIEVVRKAKGTKKRCKGRGLRKIQLEQSKRRIH